MAKIPKPLSPGEEEFALHCRYAGISYVREWQFCKPRGWRFDFAFLAKMVAVEIEGGTWTAGRHNRGSGYEADLEKYNQAALMGWKVLRYTPAMVHTGTAIDEVRAALGR